ncbi:MAG: RNA ligase/cyclic nucleotide phosphodiesterase [candidate division WS6 bacterium 36_33]|uniref:RNA ligase/cyclic nucleotide phosphodiesterase n=1 Tax=candidate division WS6 bacterium 36_33 TaxID=1641388 RepID=A0A101GZV9_9BACT|nr:MAG: RNA ligase/cyclic nucleotide phosphodiesterase [candidate division WS6 bacterium 36_33]
MNFFLGIFPDKETVKEIKSVVVEVEEVFEGFDIPVRWSKPDNYHMTLIHLGEKLPLHKKLFFKYKLKNFSLARFKLKFNKVKLGINRKYKELIYMDLLEGGDEMRKLYLELRNLLNLQDDGNFMPHLTLGRVSKELTDQEYANICRDLSVVTKRLDINKIQFFVNELKLVKSKDGEYQVLINLSDSSNIKL